MAEIARSGISFSPRNWLKSAFGLTIRATSNSCRRPTPNFRRCERSEMDNILITGGAGFIGSHLALRLLRQGKRLAIVDNLDDYYPAELKLANLEEVKASGEFQYFPTDVRDGEKLREVFATFKPEAVIHL